MHPLSAAPPLEITWEFSEPVSDEVYVMPTTVAQQRFWILDQLEPGNPSLNMPLALKLVGRLDLSALEKTLNEIVARHETLRTTFHRDNGTLAQVIAIKGSVDLDVIDLRGHADPQGEADRLTVVEAHRSFDLRRGPLFVARLLRIGESEHILLLTLHHIVCDGWSNGVLVREIGEIYDAFSQGLPSPYCELPIQYADFAAWQQEWLNKSEFEDQLTYWKQQIGSELPALEIPTDYPRGEKRASYGSIESLLIPQPLSRAIKVLGRREDATPFMIFLAAFNVLLHRYSGQDVILIGSPTANRPQSETEGLIGPFANTLLLKSDLSGSPTFKELLHRVKNISLGAFSNQTLPFEKLIETIKPTTNGLKRGQLFQVLFIFQSAFMKPMDLAELSITPLRSVSPGSIFDLSLGIVERGEGVRLQLEYNTDLFQVATARRMLEDLQRILQSAILDADRTISELLPWTTPLASRVEEEKLAAETTLSSATGSPVSAPSGDDHLEQALTNIWKDILQLDSVAPTSDFFEVGGHSLLAAQLFDEIRKRTGVDLSLATLFTASTIEQLAEVIRLQRPTDVWTSLVPINPQGTKPPLYLMHAAGGNVLFYKDIADRLGKDQPCYGMQAVGLGGHQSAYDRVEDMAAHYLKEIRGVQPNGPYYLGGASVGGLIAFEAASQLKKAGEDVGFVVLFDTAAPGYPRFIQKYSRLSRIFFGITDTVLQHLEALWISESGKRWKYVSEKATKVRNRGRRIYKQKIRSIKRGVLANLGRSLPDALVVTQNAISAAARNYSPAPYYGEVILFRAAKQHRGIEKDDTLGWSKFAVGDLKIHEISGNHGTIIVEPRVRFTAAIVKEYLDAVSQR